jgi:glycogen debranching enzyme
MDEEILIRSTAAGAVRTSVAVDLRCDLTPLESAKLAQTRPDIPASLTRPAPSNASSGEAVLVFRGEGTTVTIAATGAELSTDSARLTWCIDLPVATEVRLRWTVRSADHAPVIVAPRAAIEWTPPTVAADDLRIGRLLAQSLDDVAALRLADSTDPDDTFIGAGVPWFLTLFGRDSLWAARMMLPLGTRLAEGTLRALARRQGTRSDARSGEAPGKIMHELRRQDIWHRATLQPTAYYGTIDATLLWISLLADAWRWGMPDTTAAGFLPNLRRALSWMEHHADPDGDGFVEYLDQSGRGIANQGWKDSGGSIRFHDGSLAQPPIALCEVQGYAHRAALDAAALLDVFDDAVPRDAADRWRRYAADLEARFRERFWVSGPSGTHPALALDARGMPVDSLTSNCGHLLGTGILNREEESIVANQLGGDAMSDAYGLRTMSTLDASYAPLSYHCGSVWPHDTAIALIGLASAGADGVVGADAAAMRLLAGLLDAAEAFDYRLPEMYGGDGRAEIGRPVPHPAACRPQAWSATAAVAVLQAGLGLAVDVPRRSVRLRPLPGVGAIDVRGLQVAGSAIEVRIDGAGAASIHGLPDGMHSNATTTLVRAGR